MKNAKQEHKENGKNKIFKENPNPQTTHKIMRAYQAAHQKLGHGNLSQRPITLDRIACPGTTKKIQSQDPTNFNFLYVARSSCYIMLLGFFALLL